ncbi:hypothetical protein PENSOL_c006G06154 [Penicillium solitum]|uniref:Uncharacterized protein n=1 Tax=Penicillium solitum TaxID=60172 RepID=A0A1V6RD67_9EURO|nr:uncharacterized protein PENSOL_c006G06154 [Penicillium solitum]OQD99488.1 hypothetical protein PENSOL_c006G06154 [Penicillium solitum]
MTLASKLRQVLTCGQDESYGTLSEVAAPAPVEPTTEEEEARHESLDKNISGAHSHPQLGNN